MVCGGRCTVGHKATWRVDRVSRRVTGEPARTSWTERVWATSEYHGKQLVPLLTKGRRRATVLSGLNELPSPSRRAMTLISLFAGLEVAIQGNKFCSKD